MRSSLGAAIGYFSEAPAHPERDTGTAHLQSCPSYTEPIKAHAALSQTLFELSQESRGHACWARRKRAMDTFVDL